MKLKTALTAWMFLFTLIFYTENHSFAFVTNKLSANHLVALPTGINKAKAISVGFKHVCAIVDQGKVKCWGLNYGVLGSGNVGISDFSTPVEVLGIQGATAISLGFVHSCALIANGEIKCWGLNDHGQLGNGNLLDSYTPVSVQGITGATAISLGYLHSCAVISNGEIKCWGHKGLGQLGDGSMRWSYTPVKISF